MAEQPGVQMQQQQQQRAFAKNIKPHSALQIRQSASASVRAADKSRPKLRVVEPLDYEGELITRRKDLEKETYLNLLLFPQQDVTVADEDWEHRTEVQPVTADALKEARNLFTFECLKFYCGRWHRVDYSFNQFTSSYSQLLSPDVVESLNEETFEVDLMDEERYASLTIDKSRGTPLSKKGYLYKGPFPQDGAISVSMKNYRKRWFVLTGGPREGGYTLTFYKDEKSTSIKGKISLDTCTEVKKNSRYKACGFDVVTDDDRIFYPLAADGEVEMEEWMNILTRAISLEVEETDAGLATINSFYARETLKDSKKIDIRPEMLEYTQSTDAQNARRRELDRYPLFTVYPPVLSSASSSSHPGSTSPLSSSLPPALVTNETQPPTHPPQHKFGFRFFLKCLSLNFKLKAERNGNLDHIEPFFVTFALYDANKCLKISENFHVDLNSAFLKQMVPAPEGHTDDGPHPLCMKAARATEGIFSVTFPHQDVYLVAKIEKVLQGSMSSCAEPYIKDFENPKAVQKAVQHFSGVASRLGQYRMPFAWAVRPLFTSALEIDKEAEFSPLFRQEQSKLSDDDIIKLLGNFRTLHKQKLQVIPGELKVNVTALTQPVKNDILDPSYLPLKRDARGTDYVDGSSTSPIPRNPTLELGEFPPLDSYHPHTSYQPHYSFNHHMYVYPAHLKYDNQKSFTKARNLTCRVQFKDVDEPDSLGHCVIYSKSAGAAFIDRAYTAVAHHCTSPAFYEEVKIKLPLKLQPTHHILFTFFHISCDVQKGKSSKSSTKLPPLESPVGFAWQPLLDSAGRPVSGSYQLPVSTFLPSGYLGISQSPVPSTNSLPRGGTVSPEIRWVDSQKLLFKVTTRLDSTICCEDSHLHSFFMVCQQLQGKGSSGPSVTHLLSSIKGLEDMGCTSLMNFMPLVFTQLFKLVSLSTPKDIDNIKPDILRLLLSLVHKVVEVDGTDSLRTYIQYVFQTEVEPSKKRGVHDELAKLLLQYLKQTSSDGGHISNMLEQLWFFLEVMTKSMAQFLTITSKVSSSRKSRYSEEYGWNLQNLVTTVLTHIRDRHTKPAAKSANQSLALFIKTSFSFMDRGVVFRMVARYLEAFSVQEEQPMSNLKLEFIRIVCEHEHFIPLNLPFPVAPESMEYGLSDEFCRRHFLIGILLREVESALEYEAGPIRAKTLKMLRDILAKHDCDVRYSEAGQKGRIATLYFPLVPLVLDHVPRLDAGCEPIISPMLNVASMATYKAGSGDEDTPLSMSGSVPNSASGTLKKEKEKERDRSLDRQSLQQNSNRLSFLTAGAGHARKPSDVSLEQAEAMPLSLESTFSSLAWKAGLDAAMRDMDKLTVEETRDLLMATLFVLKHLDTRVLHHWWQECMGSSNTATLLLYDEVHTSQFSQLMDFFDLLESCMYSFKYPGRSIAAQKLQKDWEQQFSAINPAASLPVGGKEKEKLLKKGSMIAVGSPTNSLQITKVKAATRSSTMPSIPASPSMSSRTAVIPEEAREDMEKKLQVQGALANEVGLVILSLLDHFTTYFRRELSQDEGDNILMAKFFSLLMTFLHVNQSVTLQTHVFALLRSFIYKYREALFKGSAEYCGILCYEILQHCNSRLQSTRTEATVLLYLLMKYNFEYFKNKGFIRTNLQSTIAVSKLVSTLIGQGVSDAHLRRSLATIATFVSQDTKVQATSFPMEVKELMVRLKTVLSSTSQMVIHQNDPEKMVDLHYSLAKSYGNSPELRQTWLDSMTALHLKYGNYSEAAQCCIHIAGLLAEYLKIKKLHPAGCSCFQHISPNVALEESSIKQDQETGDEQTFSERNLIVLLETSMSYLEKAERYEMMSEVLKLLQPFYDKNKDFVHMAEMYGKLHEAFRKVVDIMATGKRYLGTYFRIAFYGKPFGEDHEKQFIYKEPKVTTLAELTLRLQKLFIRKFGAKDIVHIIKESGKVSVTSLDLEHAHIQITHVQPYFSAKDLDERKTKFERENNISKFVFETPFTQEGKAHGDVTKQCMRKTILTTSHWFPYVKKRIPVIHQEQFELSPIQVAIEAMDKKTKDLAVVVKMDPPDVKRLQLLLAGSISTQVNQGIQEYIAFFKDPSRVPLEHLNQLKQVYRTFLQVCQEALELNGRLIATDQLLYQDDLKTKFHQMETDLSIYLDTDAKRAKSPTHSEGYNKRRSSRVDPHRMSAILFHSISSNK